MVRTRPFFRYVASLTLALALEAGRAGAQVKPPPLPGTPTATVAAGARYHSGSFRRFFVGDNYRDLWSTPITVPVLDLRTFAGGLTPTKMGGGNQTMSLRFDSPNGSEFVFRLVDKDGLHLPAGYKHTIVEKMVRGQVSAQHPAGAVVADVLLIAAGVLHPTPILAVMPDDSLLGKFREKFAGRLGMIEPYPNIPDSAAGFAGAVEIIDSDSLQVLIDTDPREQVDTRAYLTARLVDMFMNDWDRHSGNWKWAKMGPQGMWQPIARDRDKVMISYGGYAAAGNAVNAQLMRFQKTFPSMRGLTANGIDLDRRLLSGLEVSAFDSIAVALVGRLTDPVIETALRAMPSEYQATVPDMAAKLRARRAALPAHAKQFYEYLAGVINVNATDASDSATVTLVDDRHVEIEISSGNAAPYFRRRFDANETREIRLYLHGGADWARVRGDAKPAIKVRVIGGNGTNDLIDVSKAAGQSNTIRFYDEGTVTGIKYSPDPTFDRRPWLVQSGEVRDPGKDSGSRISPAVRLEGNGDELGLVTAVGASRTTYGFDKRPYGSRVALVGEYAAGIRESRVLAFADKRWETTPLHVTVKAHWSQYEVVNFYGFGNDTPAASTPEYYKAPQRQWMANPALAYSLGPRSNIMIGPVFKYSNTDTASGHYLSSAKPYGIGDFGQAGLRVGIYKDNRIRAKDAYSGVLLDLSATFYPAVLDVTSQFAVFDATTAAYLTFPMIAHPVLSLKAGAKQVHGDFPFHEAAFVGGEPSERKLPRERYAGDAALYGSAELRVPVVDFALVLPIDIGVYVYGNAGRVFVDRESPDGWHNSRGAGMWIGILNPVTGVGFDLGNSIGRNIVQAKIGFSF